MRLLFLSICFTFSISGISQSGYLGKKNYFELKAGLVPSYKIQNIVKDDQAIERLKLGNMNYHLSYSRVLSKSFVVSAGYDFSLINCISQGHKFNQTVMVNYPDGGSGPEQYVLNILDDPKLIYHGGTISIDHFRLGSLAPVGKYTGISFSYGVASMQNQEVTVGKRGFTVNENFYRKVSEIGLDSTYYFANKFQVRSLVIKARFGRSYPLTDNLMLSVGMSFPLLSSYSSGASQNFGFSLFSDNKADDVNEVSTSWNKYYMRSVYFYNQMTIEAAIRYHF